MYSNQWELSELSEWLLRSTLPGSVLEHLPHFIRTRAKRQNNECGFLSEVDQTSQGRTDRLGCCSGRNRCGGYLRHSGGCDRYLGKRSPCRCLHFIFRTWSRGFDGRHRWASFGGNQG